MVDEVVLEFARAQQAGDPFAFRFEPQSYLLRTEGGGFESSELPWTVSLLSDLAALQKPGLDRVIVQRVGELLRRFVSPIDMVQIDKYRAWCRKLKRLSPFVVKRKCLQHRVTPKYDGSPPSFT